MKMNEVTEASRGSIYEPGAEKFEKIRQVGRQISNAIEPSSGVKWEDDELWNKASQLGTMLSELPGGMARTPAEAMKKAGITSKDEVDAIMAKVAQAKKAKMPEPEPADEPEDDEFAAPDDSEIARQADARAAKRK